MKARLLPIASLLALAALVSAQEREEEYWRIETVEAPKGVVLEVGGLLELADGRVLATTRRGEIWAITAPYSASPTFRLWADGLQEPLGLIEKDGYLWTAQRTELTRMKDEDGDGRGDRFDTVCDAWNISGNYHEYAFGPAVDREGRFWITLNKPFGDEPFGRVDWRGWAIRCDDQGHMEPVACGLRSPAGVACSPDGEMFYTDNQGEWCGAGKLSLLEVGDFHGHPHGIESARRPESLAEYPGEVPDRIMMPLAAKRLPHFKLPAVWFPYDKMGKSPSGFVWDCGAGVFGPFAGQILVGDQHHSSILRCFLERVNGRWQGACFRFREGFDSGIVRLAFSRDGRRLLAGETNRGWGSEGGRSEGLQWLEWTGKTPFEILEMRALPEGFRLVLTAPVDPATARPSSFRMESYTYRLHSDYGSDEMEKRRLEIEAVQVAADGRSLDLRVKGLRGGGYVHELLSPGLRAADGRPLLHPEADYTLVERPR